MAAQQALILQKAKSMSKEMGTVLKECKQVVEVASGHLHDYYKSIPASELSERIALTFKTFDLNNDGTMDMKELGEAMAQMGMRPSDEELNDLFKMYDLDGNGIIELDEYEHIVRVSLKMESYCKCRMCSKKLEQEKMEADLEAMHLKKEDFLASEKERLEKEKEKMSSTGGSVKTPINAKSTKDNYFAHANPKEGKAVPKTTSASKLPATSSKGNLAAKSTK